MPLTETVEPKDKLILIVDDDEDFQEFLNMALKREGFHVEQAFDGREAMRKIQRLMPNIILLDMMFPRHGGQDIITLLQHGPTASIPVIGMSGYIKDRFTKGTISLAPNVVEFFEKPLAIGRLIRKVHQLLDTRPPSRRKHGAQR